MLNGLEIGRIAGIPIYLDMFFVLVLLLFTYPYFTSGNTQAMSAGFVIIVGILLSILLHELGHAFAGRPFKAHVSHIELTGLGGLAHFERSLPRSVLARTVIYLAGPAVNLGLWYGFGALAQQALVSGAPNLAYPLGTLARYQLHPPGLQPAARLSARRRLDARFLARPTARPGMVGAYCGEPRPRRRRRRRPALGAACAQHLSDLHRPLPRHGELAAAAKRRRVAEVGPWSRRMQ